MKYIKRIVGLIYGITLMMCLAIPFSIGCYSNPRDSYTGWFMGLFLIVGLLLGPVFGDEIMKWYYEE